MTNAQLVDQLREFEILAGVPIEQIQWVVERSELHEPKQGDLFFNKGDQIDRLFMLMEGLLAFRLEQNGQFKEISRFEKGAISGALPYSRAETALAIGQCLTDSKILTLSKAHFDEMISSCHEFTAVLVHQMTDRVRTFTRKQQQDEKLMALGKLSAGLAHELNNPAAAIVRSAESLQSHLGTVPDKFKKMMSAKISPESVDLVNKLLYEKVERGVDRSLSLMERSNLEDDLTDWLEDQGFGDCYMLSETLADYGFQVEELEKLYESIGEEVFPRVIQWVDNVLTTEKMVVEIKEASNRISGLVNAVKSYSHMDRAADFVAIDIHEGIKTTMTMLNHKLKKGNIEVVDRFEEGLPTIQASPGELNQVWTNIIDNAIDALEGIEKPQLVICSKQEGDTVTISIEDNGPGIPDEIQDRIYEPFFTTKAIGKGTGLGLETVKKIIEQHQGNIELQSQPGQTIFKFCFPIRSEK